ncbi:MAG: prepilin-type N-terminal cleavage/methylation domain-containing protein, partial [Aquificota bacterium]|nr:prepilin-type N-terminal cleavage/methylation domain-containing protein [Aquificota bacterium]
MRELYQAFPQARRLSRQKGFTLIELLVVIAIIAILAAIAIPQFAKYRVRAFNSAAESDIRNIRTTMEAIYADVQTYGNNSVFSTAP